jgi:hypothetical protein
MCWNRSLRFWDSDAVERKTGQEARTRRCTAILKGHGRDGRCRQILVSRRHEQHRRTYTSSSDSPPTMSTLVKRKAIAQDTVARSPAIVAETPGASEESTFVAEQLAPLYPESPRHGATAVRIVNSDSFTAARKMAGASGAQDSIAVLNLASDMLPGGGWYDTLCRTQVRGRTALHVCDL